MNKTKKVAWHKHLKHAKKLKDRESVAQKSVTPTSTTTRR